MTVLGMRPVGWDGMTPRQWHVVRDMIQAVNSYAWNNSSLMLWVRAERFLANTEGRDV